MTYFKRFCSTLIVIDGLSVLRESIAKALSAIIGLSLIVGLFSAPLRGQIPDCIPNPRTKVQGSCPPDSHPDSLWALAQACERSLTGNCRDNRSKDYVIVKDGACARKPYGYLAIPTKCVTGIEDDHIFDSPLADLWQEAWLQAIAKLPHADPSLTGLAINSKKPRSQNQLHIHMSCISQQLRKFLAGKNIQPYQRSGSLAPKAEPTPVTLCGHRYEAVKVTGLTGDYNPFKIVNDNPKMRATGTTEQGYMAQQSIAVIGSGKPNEFYVLNTTYEESVSRSGQAEELLDQHCSYMEVKGISASNPKTGRDPQKEECPDK